MRRLVLMIPALALLAGMWLPGPSRANPGAQRPLVVIVGTSAGMSDISLALLRRTFQGEPAHTKTGKRLVPLNHQLGSKERVFFDRVVLGLEPSQVGQFWIDRRIRDQGVPPRTLPSPDFAVRVVVSYPGAITYVNAHAMPSSVQVLRVDGKLPGEAGYLLQGD